MAKTYRAPGQRVDYLLIKNLARFRSQVFDESALAELFRRQGAPVIELPTITRTTMQEIETAGAARKKHLTLAEAAKMHSIPHICRNEIELLPLP